LTHGEKELVMRKLLSDFRLIRMLKVPFGIKGAIKVYWQLKRGKNLYKVHLPLYGRDIFLREHSSDFSVFLQVFCLNDYLFNAESDINTIVDAGANVGYTAVYFSRRYPNAKIICIEPDQKNFELLKMNTEGLANVTCLLGALWNEETSISLIDDGHQEWGYITVPSDGLDNPMHNKVKTYTVTGIKELMGFKQIGLLKMDIEGSEREVFENGYDEWLGQCRYIIIELHDRLKPGCTKNVFKAVAEYDYSSRTLGEHILLMNESLNKA